jgi:hypothetical protein
MIGKKPEYDLYAGRGKDLRMAVLSALMHSIRIEAAKGRDAVEINQLKAAANCVENVIVYIQGAKR